MAGRCPNCDDTLREIRFRDTQLDMCRVCRGVWFDRGELSALEAPPPLPSVEELQTLPGRERWARCPRRDGRLRSVNLQGQRMDVCPVCQGVWLDREDLQRLRRGDRLRQRLDYEHHEHLEGLVEAAQDGPPPLNAFWSWVTGLIPEIYSPTLRRPHVTHLLILLNLLVMGWELYLLQSGDLEAFGKGWGLVPSRPSLTTSVTSMFIHAGLGHLLVNLWALWLVGDNVEDRVGHLRYLGLFLLCGIAGDLSHILACYATDTNLSIATVGASGAIAGLMGAYLVFFPRRKLALRLFLFLWYGLVFRVSAWILIGAWFLSQFVFIMVDQQWIAWWAHIGGFMAGAAAALVIRGRRRES